MASGVATNRTNIDLPPEVSSEIIQKTQEQSAVMRLAKKVQLPGLGSEIPMITSDPEPEWVSETATKPVKGPGLSKKIMTPYTLAVILPFSNQFKRDLPGLYNAIKQRVPAVLGAKFDSTCFGFVAKPGSNFDNFAACTAQNIGGTNTYDGLVAADSDIADHFGDLNGFAISPKAKSVLLTAKDLDGRPLFIDSAKEGEVPMILGAPTYKSRGAFKAGTALNKPNIVGVAGDWTQAMWGTVEGIQASIATEATLVTGTTGSEEYINLFQQNMFALRFEIELGFIADTTCFNLLTTPYVPGGATGATGATA